MAASRQTPATKLPTDTKQRLEHAVEDPNYDSVRHVIQNILAKYYGAQAKSNNDALRNFTNTFTIEHNRKDFAKQMLKKKKNTIKAMADSILQIAKNRDCILIDMNVKPLGKVEIRSLAQRDKHLNWKNYTINTTVTTPSGRQLRQIDPEDVNKNTNNVMFITTEQNLADMLKQKNPPRRKAR